MVSTPLKHMKVRLDHHPNYWGKYFSHVPNRQPDIDPGFFMGYCWYINGGYCYIIKHPDPSHKPPWTVRRVPDPWPPPGPVKMASCLTQFAATLQTGTPRFASQKWHGKCWKDLERSGNLGDHRTTILETTKRDFSATLCGCCYTRYWWYCQGFMAG